MKLFTATLFSVTMLFAYSFTASADGVSPGAVIDLNVTPENGQIKLEWCKPKGSPTSSLGYEVYRKSQDKILAAADIAPENRIGVIGSDGGCISFTDTAVSKGTTYSYAVIVVDDFGNRSAISRSNADQSPIAVSP